MPSQQNRWGVAFTLLALVFIGSLTLRPAPQAAEEAARSQFLCLFPCGNESLRDAVLNVILFVPLGVALRLWLPGRLSLLIAVATTCAIEFTQYAFLVGRDASLRDILTNSLGALAGIWLARRWRRLVLPGAAASRRLAGAAGVGWLAIVAGTAFGVKPSLPRTTYWGQWAPELGQFAIYEGKVLDLRVNGRELPHGRMADSRWLRSLLLQDSVLVTATVVSGHFPPDAAPIASVFDSDQREIFVLGQSRRAMVFRIRTGLVAGEFGAEFIALRGIPGTEPGDTLRLTGGLVHGAYLLRAVSGRDSVERRVPLSAGWGWTGLMPFKHPVNRQAPWATVLWLGGLLFPTGYWLGRGAGRAFGLLALAAVVAAGLAGLAPLAGLLPAAWWEWAGSVAGGLSGWLGGRRSRACGPATSVGGRAGRPPGPR